MQTNIVRHSPNRSRYLVVSILFLLFIFMAPVSAEAQDENSIATLRQMGKAFASVAEKASPAVVGIKSEKEITQRYYGFGSPFGEQFDPFSDDFFDFFRRRSPRRYTPRTPQRKQMTTAMGSGFIISADGYVLTNNHLVGEAEKVVIELADGRKFIATAEDIKTDEDSDIAVVKIDAKNLPYLKLADSDALEVGEWVLAIGNPLGLSHTVTAGIVSAKGRSGFDLATLENFIQTDAAINFGNSGGPLINLDGEAVGINAAIAAATGNIGIGGIGFAIPINMAKHVYEQLKKSGKVERGFLGVILQDMDADMAKAFGLKDNKGVLIPHVDKDSAADKAGLKHNDVILEFNGEPVESANELQNRIAMLKPGTSVKIVVWRDEKQRTLTAELDKRDSESGKSAAAPAETLDEIGFSVRNLSEEIAERYGYEGQSGVIIDTIEPGSQADKAHLEPGMLIKEVNQAQVKNTKEFNEAIKKAKKKGNALLLVRYENYSLYVLLMF